MAAKAIYDDVLTPLFKCSLALEPLIQIIACVSIRVM